MCGRFVASRPISDIVDIFAVEDLEVPEELTMPRWNVAPQAGVLAVTMRRPKPETASQGPSGHKRPEHADAESSEQSPDRATAGPDTPARRRLTSYRWGLVPSWAKDPNFGARAFNARAESLLDKSAFKNAVARRRCLIPAEAFYEWEKGSPASGHGAKSGGRRPRQPWCYRAPDGELLAFAGLWEAWRARPAEASGSPEPAGPNGRPSADGTEGDPASTGWHDDWLLSCTIITTPANETVSPVHDRMPLVLGPADWEAWLRPGALEARELASLLRTPRVGLLEAYEVSIEVNASSAEGPQLVEPLTEESEAEPTLF